MLPIIYVVFTAFVILIILLAYQRVLHSMAIPARDRSRKFIVAVAYIVGWISYLIVLSVTDVLKDLSLPPKFPILVLAPLMIGMIAFYRRSMNSAVVHAIPHTWPVYFQSFRIIVELILLFTFFAGIIPESATFHGLNFDVIMGISAPFVAYFLVRKNPPKRFLYFWNILGICMVLFVGFIIATSMYFPSIWESDISLVRLKFVEMPYLLLAGFLAPLAIFMHVVSLIHLRK